MVEKILWIAGFALLLGLSRIIPHPPNFTPVLAVAVFIPTLIKDQELEATLVTLGAMFIGDLYWGLHSFMFWTYGSVILAVLFTALGYNIWINALTASVGFFVVTNFGVWASGYYGLTFEGLVACYIAAIPFFTNTLLGTLFYVAIFKGIEHIHRRLVTA
jgi:hypothetical protein